MITGTITDLRPHIKLFIKGEGIQAFAEFTIDTGYSGTMTLPLEDCVMLKLPRVGERDSFLADGSTITLEMYLLSTHWDGTEIPIEILAIGQERLLGAGMLKGYKLCLDFGNNTLIIEASTTTDEASE